MIAMKNLKVFTVFVVCLFFVSASVNAMEFNTKIKDYEIEVVENLNLGKSAEKVWNLTYTGCEKPVTVVKRNTANGAVYVVNNQFFEVCYAATSEGFGTRSMKKAWRSVPSQINEVVLNNEEIQKQKIITPKEVDDKKALEYIACYLPSLLNEEYSHLVN